MVLLKTFLGDLGDGSIFLAFCCFNKNERNVKYSILRCVVDLTIPLIDSEVFPFLVGVALGEL